MMYTIFLSNFTGGYMMSRLGRVVVAKLMLIFAVFCLAAVVQAEDEMGMINVSKAKTAEVAKAIVALKGADSAIKEITVLVTGMDGNTMKIASTTAGEAGKDADPEDIDAILDNKVVAIVDGGSVDVTVPIANKDGLPAAIAGTTVSLENGLTKDKAQAKAEGIAKKIGAILNK